MISKYSIAVLPFENLSADRENDYFSDGISVEIINSLSKIEGLHITARSSSFAFKGKQFDIREIGEKLNVALVLEGSIRKAGTRVRITAQLTQTGNGFHLWSETWDRELLDIFKLQDEIAALIAEKINAELHFTPDTNSQLVNNLEALDAYLKANFYLNTFDFSRGEEMLQLFEKAIRLDPGLIKAYMGLSNAVTWLGSTGHLSYADAQEKISFCVTKVLELDPNYPDIYLLTTSRHFWMDWDIGLALEDVNKALQLKPSFPEALIYKALLLAASGYVQEALDSFFRADRLDPYAQQINSGIGMIYNYIGEAEKALDYIEKNIRIAPFWDAQYMFKVEALCQLQSYDEAWKTIEEIAENPKTPLSIAELKAYYYASQGKRDEAYVQLELMKKEFSSSNKPGSPDAAFFAQIHLILGEYETALDYLEEGINRGATPFLFNKINSLWDPLRNNVRYKNAMTKIVYPKDIPETLGRRKYAKVTIPAESLVLLKEKLEEHMTKDRPWLNPTLTLTDVSEALNMPSHQLSQLLNAHIGINFYDYINGFRLEHFLEILHNPRYKNFTLLSLAYECGFNSKTTFNTFFKKAKGTSPSEFIKTN